MEPEAGECQKDLGLEQKGVLALVVKNPQYRGDDAGPPFGPAISRNPHYTAEQLASFKGQRWGSCEDLSLLDAEGTELLLVGARHEPPRGTFRKFSRLSCWHGNFPEST
ncbi:hypothetical protein DUNSADRAFT_14984 [Dunaliella salina]|uniref:Uncharacterized protein n=1 Tax=Dunaliella salina TaxID=3046 RepID=A0ABQ7H281_DUNSA|nr:hypothetical protein DUNSADRAFT_14984 [Dunaliella salina]|eukprot:KAF5840960.1 hypothetical protein DUNSADRAFT_14984 [Dunaliella salina]